MSLSSACQLLFQHVLKSANGMVDALAKQGADTLLTILPLSCSFSFRHMVEFSYTCASLMFCLVLYCFTIISSLI